VADVIESLRAHLLTFQTIRNLVGVRIYQEHYPQDAKLPLLVITRLFTTHEHTLSNLAGLAKARIQFDCIADSRSIANSIAEAVRRTGIVAFKGNMQGLDVRGVMMEEGARDFMDRPNDATERHRYGVNFDLSISYTEEF
jgi:hypothetical protein